MLKKIKVECFNVKYMFQCTLNYSQQSEINEKGNIYKCLISIDFLCSFSLYVLQKKNNVYVFTYVINVLWSKILLTSCYNVVDYYKETHV